MKGKLIILSLFSISTLTSCAIREPDILPPVREIASAKIIGMRVEPPSEITFYTDGQMTEKEKKLMVEGFLTAVVIPEKDLWVNLRVEQPHRIAPYSLGITELGRTMLEQDYILKKAVSTVMYPDFESGQRFWGRMSFYGSGAKFDIRTWIYPKRTVVIDNGREMFIKIAELDVRQEKLFSNVQGFEDAAEEIVLPEVKNYVLYDEAFIPTRQVYRAVICGIWFKNKFLKTIYGSCINTNKTGSFEIPDKDMKHKVFEKYAYSYKNKDWQMGDGKNWGGIDFKSPANWVEVEKEDTPELRDANRFRVMLKPSAIPSSRNLEEGSVIRGMVGGIDLSAKIEVEEERFDAPEEIAREWEFAKSINYIFE